MIFTDLTYISRDGGGDRRGGRGVRTDDTGRVYGRKKEPKWSHDMFKEDEQKPKEAVRITIWLMPSPTLESIILGFYRLASKIDLHIIFMFTIVSYLLYYHIILISVGEEARATQEEGGA